MEGPVQWPHQEACPSAVCIEDLRVLPVFSCSVVAYSLQLHDCSWLHSSGHGILKARILVWVAISSSRGSS